MSKESNVDIQFLLFAVYKADTMLITEIGEGNNNSDYTSYAWSVLAQFT